MTAVTVAVCAAGVAWTAVRLELAERALRREQNQTGRLREMSEMRDRFLSAVSHELRNPITICRGHLDVLEDDAGARELRTVKETLITELDLMTRLVEDLTTLARPDDPACLRMEPMSLDRFMAGIARQAVPILGCRLRAEPRPGPTTTPAGLPHPDNSNKRPAPAPAAIAPATAAPATAAQATILADPQRLGQALLNLLRNAAEHARGDGPVRFRVLAESAAWRFEVADDGGGLPEGIARAVSETLRTGSPSAGSRAGGAATDGRGLGLSIVSGIARAHGGDSGVVNRPGLGATFWIRIPR